MATTPANLMEKYYSSEYGTVDVQSVLEELRELDMKPVSALMDLLQDPAQSRWRLSAADGMRALAAQGECGPEEARILLAATNNLAAELGADEYIKTLNALVSSERSAPLLVDFIRERLEARTPSEDDRWLAFYAAGLIAQRRTAKIPVWLRDLLDSAANNEPAAERRREYQELLKELS